MIIILNTVIPIRQFNQNDIFTKTTSLAPEVSLTVPDFTISVCGSSCHCLFSGLIIFSFLSLTFSWHFILPCGCQKIERESKKPRMKARMRPKQRKWMNCCTQKWLNLGLLDSPQVYYYQMVEVPGGEDVLDEDWVGVGYDENPGVQPADRLHQQLLHTWARYASPK